MGTLSPHFNREEFQCQCGCGFNTVDYELINVLEDLREHFKCSVHINSGCRCPAHNEAVGGEDASKHMFGIAADVVVNNVSEHKVADYLEYMYPTKYGIGRYKGRTHIDIRKEPARWSKL